MRSRVLTLLAATACSAAAPEPEPERAVQAPADDPALEINVAAIRSLTMELSGDAYEGRGTGSPGGRRTVAALTAHMEARGLQPADDGFTQAVALQGSRLGGVSIRPAPGSPPLDPTGFIVRSESPAGRHVWTRPFVFVGYGIDTQPGWDDYAGVDVTDKVVVALVGKPDTAVFRGRPLSPTGRWDEKLERARAHGAAGCLIVHTAAAGYDWDVVRASFSGERFALLPAPSQPLALSGWLSSEQFEQLLGQPLAEAQRDASKPGGATRTLWAPLEVSYEQFTRRIEEFNVVGRVGSGASPVVVVTAHWDHLGRSTAVDSGQDTIFNGATDNASGVASMLALASALAGRNREEPLAGTVYFVATAAEEHGLLGSQAFVRQLPVARDAIVAAINFDGMNVRDATPSVELIAAGHSTMDALFSAALARQGRTAVPDRAPQSGAAYRSDHFPFLGLGIPILYPAPGFAGSATLVRAGQERTRRYHTVSDEVDPAWSFEGAVADTRAVYEVIGEIADGNVRPRMLTPPSNPTTPTTP